MNTYYIYIKCYTIMLLALSDNGNKHEMAIPCLLLHFDIFNM